MSLMKTQDELEDTLLTPPMYKEFPLLLYNLDQLEEERFHVILLEEEFPLKDGTPMNGRFYTYADLAPYEVEGERESSQLAAHYRPQMLKMYAEFTNVGVSVLPKLGWETVSFCTNDTLTAKAHAILYTPSGYLHSDSALFFTECLNPYELALSCYQAMFELSWIGKSIVTISTR